MSEAPSESEAKMSEAEISESKMNEAPSESEAKMSEAEISESKMNDESSNAITPPVTGKPIFFTFV
jgi:hypothetical protein